MDTLDKWLIKLFASVIGITVFGIFLSIFFKINITIQFETDPPKPRAVTIEDLK